MNKLLILSTYRKLEELLSSKRSTAPSDEILHKRVGMARIADGLLPPVVRHAINEKNVEPISAFLNNSGEENSPLKPSLEVVCRELQKSQK